MKKVVKGLANVLLSQSGQSFKPKEKSLLDVNCNFFQELNKKKKWSCDDFLKFHNHVGHCEVCKERRREITNAKSGIVTLADELGLA